jgi:hypothetical protein
MLRKVLGFVLALTLLFGEVSLGSAIAAAGGGTHGTGKVVAGKKGSKGKRGKKGHGKGMGGKKGRGKGKSL